MNNYKGQLDLCEFMSEINEAITAQMCLVPHSLFHSKCRMIVLYNSRVLNNKLQRLAKNKLSVKLHEAGSRKSTFGTELLFCIT